LKPKRVVLNRDWPKDVPLHTRKTFELLRRVGIRRSKKSCHLVKENEFFGTKLHKQQSKKIEFLWSNWYVLLMRSRKPEETIVFREFGTRYY